MLVDFGSSSRFISTAAAARLSGITPLPSHAPVKIANGGQLGCHNALGGHRGLLLPLI
jgi:hypothetical protein